MAETIVESKKLSENEQQYWRDFYEAIRKHDEDNMSVSEFEAKAQRRA